MNHLWHNRIPQTGMKPLPCRHCKTKDATKGTRGGCHKCGKTQRSNGRRA